MAETEKSIRDQVWGAVDPLGEHRSLINAAAHGHHVPDFFHRIGVDVYKSWAQLTVLGTKYRKSIEAIEAAIRILVPRGWSVMSMDAETVARATRLAAAGDGNAADELLADQWDGRGEWRSKRVCDRVSVMGGSEDELRRLFGERARLLRSARDHHLAGRYDASVPLLQAQMEGIVIDVTGGRKFFTKGTQKASLIDLVKLISIEAGLAALQATYGEDVKDTQTAGSLSRHGVMHGRELAYDTRVNPAKTWSVVDALVEWALPKAQEVVEVRKTERQATEAGSQDVDERGRRVDDREIADTRDALRLLGTSAMGWQRQRGSFRDDIVGAVYDREDFAKRGLPAPNGIQQQVATDGTAVMYWRQTVSGWVLGLALRADGDRFFEQLYPGARPPTGLPSESDDWAETFETPPDWT